MSLEYKKRAQGWKSFKKTSAQSAGSIKVKLSPHSVKQDYYYRPSLSYAGGTMEIALSQNNHTSSDSSTLFLSKKTHAKTVCTDQHYHLKQTISSQYPLQKVPLLPHIHMRL